MGRLKVLLFFLLWAAIFPLLNHCSTQTLSNDNPDGPGDSNGGGPNGSGPGGGGPTGNNPGDFPTIAQLNFAAFPTDPGNCTGGNTYHVAATGNDNNAGTEVEPFRSIVKALQNAQAGDTVLVHTGNYAEGEDGDFRSLVIDKNNLRLCAAPNETVAVSPRTAAFTYGMVILGSGVLVDGIHLSGFPTALIQLGDGAILSNIILKNLTLTASGSGGKDGIATYNSQINGLLLSNVTVNNAFIGIQCNAGPCKDWRFDRVKVTNDGSQGDTGQDAIAIENGDNFLLSNVEVSGAAGDGLDFKGTNVAVFNTLVHDVARNGVKFWRGGDLVNSFVHHTGADAAVVFDRAGNYRILHSVIAYHLNGQAGAYTLTGAYDTTCGQGGSAANYCCSTQDPGQCGLLTIEITDSVFYRDSGALFFASGTGLNIRNNLFSSFGEPTSLSIRDRNLTITQADQIPSEGLGSGNLPFDTDPLYTDPSGGDFSFPNNSPLVNAGINPAPYPSYDYRGQTRILGPAPDLGPLELF